MVYTYTVTGPGPEFCTDVTDTYTYTVDVDPEVTHTLTNNDPVICENLVNGVDIDWLTPTENGSVSVIAVYGAVTGGAFAVLTPLVGASGTVNETLSNPTSAAITVTYTFTTSANSCADLVENVDVVVEPVPVITNLPGLTPDITICSGDQLSFTALSDVAGAIVSWTSAGPGTVTGNTSGSGTLTDILISTSNDIETVVYTYTVTGPGPEFCTGVTDTYTYTVDVDPVVTHTITNNDPTVCEGVAIDIDYVTLTQNGSMSLQAA